MLTTTVFLVNLVKAVVMIVVVFGNAMDAAPTERGLVKPHSSDGPLKSSEFLRQWFQTRTPDKTTVRTSTSPGFRPDHRPGSDKRDQLLKMISALEEIHRTINSTLSSRITFITRAGGRHPGKKNKLLAASDKAAVKPTTAPPVSSNSTVSIASAGTPLPGRNLKKSLPPHHKKHNKRVCFWKYCSQN